MSKRTWLILGVGLLLIAVAFFVFKWENKQEPEPEPEPVIKKPAAKAPIITSEQPVKDLTAQQNNAGDDEQLS